MKEDLYTMKCGDRIKYSIWDVFKVPGGWIYSCDGGTSMFGVFIPFNKEFIN